MSFPIRDAITSAGRFALSNPRTLINMAKQAVGLNASVPLEALRWLATNLLTGKEAPTDVTIDAHPPCIGVGALVKPYGQSMRLDCDIRIDELRFGADEMYVTSNE